MEERLHKIYDELREVFILSEYRNFLREHNIGNYQQKPNVDKDKALGLYHREPFFNRKVDSILEYTIGIISKYLAPCKPVKTGMIKKDSFGQEYLIPVNEIEKFESMLGDISSYNHYPVDLVMMFEEKYKKYFIADICRLKVLMDD